jgi:hypothetical protein
MKNNIDRLRTGEREATTHTDVCALVEIDLLLLARDEMICQCAGRCERQKKEYKEYY